MKTSTRWILAGVAALLFGIAVFAGGVHCARSCGPPGPPPPVGIDAGPGLEDIAQREEEAAAKAARELDAIELKRREDLEDLDAATRAEYEAVRERGPDAVLEWLNEFDRRRFDGDPR